MKNNHQIVKNTAKNEETSKKMANSSSIDEVLPNKTKKWNCKKGFFLGKTRKLSGNTRKLVGLVTEIKPQMSLSAS